MNSDPIGRRVSFRRSARARRLRIQVSLHRGVIVTVPRGVSDSAAHSFLRHHEDWVRRTLKDLHGHFETSGETDPSVLPEEIELRAVGVSYAVRYRGGRDIAQVRRSKDSLVVHGDLDDPAASRAALKRWLLREGRARLHPWLDEVSRETRLDYTSLSIRAQRGRWGSCNGTRAISLNCKLLFLPPTLVRYVLIHELAHTVHLNHSARFWALVARHAPEHDRLERELRRGGCLVPGWVEYVA